MRVQRLVIALALCLMVLTLAPLSPMSGAAWAGEVRLKDLGRFKGWRDNPLIGYGIVTGLSGSGDSTRNQVTQQALANALSRMGVNVTTDQVQSRNVAVVMVTATLPPSATVGDRIDVTVTSIGDAQSLAGGMLLMTPLLGPDQRSYALAQGALVVGGYHFDAELNQEQKNYPTTGILPNGATVEEAVSDTVQAENGALVFVLKNPDFTTAQHVAEGINQALGGGMASVQSAEAIKINDAGWTGPVNALLSRIENVTIEPDNLARVVINERTGTVVAGGGVQISDVVVAQGDIKVSIKVDNQASQPNIYGGFVSGRQGLIVTNTKMDVTEDRDAVMHFPGTTVSDLIEGLSHAKVTTRNMIAVLQAMKTAGALHAEIIVQ